MVMRRVFYCVCLVTAGIGLSMMVMEPGMQAAFLILAAVVAAWVLGGR